MLTVHSTLQTDTKEASLTTDVVASDAAWAKPAAHPQHHLKASSPGGPEGPRALWGGGQRLGKERLQQAPAGRLGWQEKLAEAFLLAGQEGRLLAQARRQEAAQKLYWWHLRNGVKVAGQGKGM